MIGIGVKMIKAEYLITDNAGEKITANYDGERYAVIHAGNDKETKVIILNPVEAAQLACFITSQLKLKGVKDV